MTLHPDLLASFATVAETLSFSGAAERLHLRQSTVSQHVRKLEEALKRPLFARTTHTVALTNDGADLLHYAVGILDLQRRATQHFAGSDLRGRLRFGVSEDFASSRLPDVLRDFRSAHRNVDLELEIAMSGHLYESLDAGSLDVIFAKRRSGDPRGTTAWAERLVWIGAPDLVLDTEKPVPVVTYGTPSISRARAIEALEGSGRAWRIACTSSSLSGLRAALLGGFGVAAHAERLIPPGLAPIASNSGLPRLGSIDFVAVGAKSRNKAAATLIQTLLANTGHLQDHGH